MTQRHYNPQDHQTAVHDLLNREHLLDRIHQQIATPPTPQESYDHRKISGSPTPWNDRMALLILDVHAGARQLERDLRLTLNLPELPCKNGPHRQPRPPTTIHAHAALNATLILAEALHNTTPDHETACEAQTRTERWARRARAVLDEARADELPWARCPGQLTCHLCGGPLWLKPGWENALQLEHEPVWCRRCVDDTGMMHSYPSAVWASLLADPTRETA